METINILYVLDKLSYNSGVSSAVMSYIRKIDRSKFKISIVVHKPCDEALVKETKSLGCKIYQLTDITLSGFLKYKKGFANVLKSNTFHIVHGHISNAAFLYMKEAKKQSIKHRIIHAHNPVSADSFLKKKRNDFLERGLQKWANHFFASSPEVAKRLMSKNIKDVVVIPNAISAEDYAYNPQVRQAYRQKFKLNERTVVLGSVGRLDPQKNHNFLIEVFSKYHKINPDSVLFLVGEGALREKLEKKVDSLHLKEKVFFLGKRNDANNLYQMFDAFLLPSSFEGFGIVGVEAQCSGLPCVFSDKVPKTIKFTDDVAFASIDRMEDADLWVTEIEKLLSGYHRTDKSGELKKTIFNIDRLVDFLQGLYIRMR